jgi:O-methyltransferase involved in polyketide biosynthesis
MNFYGRRMTDKINIKLGNIQETLLLPLWGRAVETKKEHPKLIDPKAIEIIENIDYDFSLITQTISPLSQLAWVARSVHIDKMISQFLTNHPQATIVNIGCGLDTTYERMVDKKVRFFDLDLPDVIVLRSNFFNDDTRRKTITSSFLDFNWIKELKARENVLLLSGGVFYYLDENQIRKFFIFLADNFKNCDLFFDYASPLGVRVANKKVISAGGMDKTAILKWGVKKAEYFESWDQRIKVVKEFPMFFGFKKGYSIKIKYGLWMSDFLKIMSMVHLRIENS